MNSTTDIQRIRSDRAALVQILTGAGAEFRGDSCKCIFPPHEDSNASAGVYEKDGVWRYKCQGCGFSGDIIDIKARLNSRSVADELRDLRANAGSNGHHNGNGHAAKNGKPKTCKTHPTWEKAIEAAEWATNQKREGGYKFAKSWPYERLVDGAAVEHGRIIRLESPDDKYIWPVTRTADGFQLRDPDGKWPPLYEPDLADGGLIIVNEGEGKADICRAMGFNATCSSHGAKSAGKTDWRILAGQDVAVILDNDANGEAYGNDVATIVTGLTPPARVKLIRLPGLPKGGDVKEWVHAGGTAEQLQQIIDAAPYWTPAVDLEATKPKAAPAQPSPEILPDSAPRTLAAAFLATRSELRHFRSEFYGRERSVYVQLEREDLRATLAEFLSRQMVTNAGAPVLFQPNTRRINETLDAMSNITQAFCKTMPAWLDGGSRPDPANVIAFQNGLIDVAEFVAGKLRLMPPDAAWFSTTVLPFNFDRQAPAPVRWQKFLAELWPDDAEAVALFQEWCGYCLSADTSQQKILLLAGPPRSGKGTAARILEQLIGPGNVAGPTLAGIASNFGLASLIGKPLATIADARLSGRTDQAIVVERLLSISGEDGLTIDRKNRDAVTLRLPTRLMLLSNELPKLSDASGALAERFLILVLKRSFLGHEDTELTRKLSTELPGILLWALDGWKRLRARGRFAGATSGAEAMDELRDLVSPIKAFVRERCEVGAGRAVTSTHLYEAWSTWCKQQGREHPGSQQSLGRDLRAAFPAVELKQVRETGTTNRTRVYEGIGINSEMFPT